MMMMFFCLIVFGEVLIDFICDDVQYWYSVVGGLCWNVVCVGV